LKENDKKKIHLSAFSGLFEKYTREKDNTKIFPERTFLSGNNKT